MLRDLNAPFMDNRRALRVTDGIVETNSELVKLVFDASATQTDDSVDFYVNWAILSFTFRISNCLDLFFTINYLYSLSRWK